MGHDGTGPAVLVLDGEPGAPAGLAWCGPRDLMLRSSPAAFAPVARALMLAEWERTHRHCGRCGTPTVAEPGEHARRCPACGLRAYPRLSPVVIVAVTAGERILLARAARFPPGLFSVLAGFVEAGETLEEAVHREVREEVGVRLADVRYAGSQPWPFPHQLMVGFTAVHAGGAPVPDGAEIVEARWFGAHELPRLPPPASIARRLVDAWAAGAGGAPGGRRDAGTVGG
jgi:NAD+ diphosphatase